MLDRGVVLDERYELEHALGSGGQGAVWAALDRLTGTRRALKVLDVGRASATARERAQREAEQLVQLEHPSIVHCFGLFADPRRELLVLVLEYVQGRSLAECAEDSRFTLARRLEVLQHVAEALAHAHATGIVHRDVKPDNVIVSDDFFSAPDHPRAVRLVDFGIAVPTGNPNPLTRENRTVGTRAYMAPEQIDPATWGNAPDAPALDVFAWGVMAWQLLVGGHPSGVRDPTREIDLVDAYRRAREKSGALELPDTPWTSLIAPALALDPRQRLRDGGVLCRRLKEVPSFGQVHLSLTTAGTEPATTDDNAGGTQQGAAGAPIATTGSGATLEPRLAPQRTRARTGLLRAPVLVLAAVGAVALAGLGVVALMRPHRSAWGKYVCTCCKKSPQYVGHACAENGATLADDARWWVRFQWATDKDGRALQDSNPLAEVCAKPEGGSAVCWPAKRAGKAEPLEVTTHDLVSGALQVWIREPGPGGNTVVLGRMKTSGYASLSTGVLCEGIAYGKSIAGSIRTVAFSVEPVGEDLSVCRGF
jgi:Protein kinase domain